MSIENLGGYGEVTQAAKAVGGMDNYIALIKDGAVAEVAPSIFTKGAIIGAGVVAVGAFAVNRVNAYRAKRALRIELGDAAADELRRG